MENYRSIVKMNIDRFNELRNKSEKSQDEKEEYEALIYYLSITLFPRKSNSLIIATT